jgi:hypothetical protein
MLNSGIVVFNGGIVVFNERVPQNSWFLMIFVHYTRFDFSESHKLVQRLF